MNEVSIAWFGLIGAIVGAVPGLLGVVVPWLKDRDRTSAQKRYIELAKAEVELISAWLDAIGKVAGDKHENVRDRARERLDRLFCIEATLAEREDIGTTAPSGDRPKSTAFFVYLGFYCFLLFGTSIDDSGNASIDQLLMEASGEGMGALIVMFVPLLLLFIRWRRSIKRTHIGSGHK